MSGHYRSARGLFPLLGLLTLLTLLSVAPAARTLAGEPRQLEIPSLDQDNGAPIRLPAFWFPSDQPGRSPAMVLLHGCGGPYAESTAPRLSRRMRDYAELLNAQGIHVLITDSLSPRGERELCTQRNRTRAVTQTQRRRDALGALQLLAREPRVDPLRLGLMGWSNGGSTVLAATNLRHPEVASAAVRAAFAVAYYPGCEDELRRGYQADTTLLMMVGELDDWTPPGPCRDLTIRASGNRPQLQIYPGAYHGFDGTAAVRLRLDVPNGVNPGQGVHAGGEPGARAASRERLLGFLKDVARPH